MNGPGKNNPNSSARWISPPTTPESFNYETKYIVLNFMSMIPERYTSNPHTPSTTTSESDHFVRKISKPRSLPSSPPKHRDKYKSSKKYVYRGKLPPQASEDNVSYRYRKESEKYSKQNTSNESENSASIEDFLSISQNSGESPTKDLQVSNTSSNKGLFNMAQFRQKTMNRAESEISNYTSDGTDYTSDADDELEDTSNASSVLGSSLPDLRNRGSFGDGMDFLHISRLPTVPSESELEIDSLSNHLGSPGFDVVDGRFTKDVKSPVDINDVELEVAVSDININDVKLEVTESDIIKTGAQDSFDGTDSTSISIAVGDTSSTTVNLDRSKLKLDIPDHQEWQPGENRKLELILAEMRAELEDEITSFESEVDEAIKKNIIGPMESPIIAPISPQTEAARVLARIGDEVKDHYEQKLREAVGRLFVQQRPDYLNYDNFRRIANEVLDHNLPGWRQVTLILMYGQHAAWIAVENNIRGIGDFVDYTTRLIEDTAADFIIQQGGWGAVMNFDPSQSSESPASPVTPDSLKDIPSIEDDSIHNSSAYTGKEEVAESSVIYNNSTTNNNSPRKEHNVISPFSFNEVEFIEFEEENELSVPDEPPPPPENSVYTDYILLTAVIYAHLFAVSLCVAFLKRK